VIDRGQSMTAIARLAVLDEGPALLAVLDDLSPAPGELAVSLFRHQLGDLVVSALGPVPGAQPTILQLTEHLARLRKRPRVSSSDFLAAYAEVQRALTDAGIAVLLLKGAVLGARLYGGISRRPQTDLDVLVHRTDAGRARRTLVSLGYRRHARDRHSVTLVRGGIYVDLHSALRSAPAYRIDEVATWSAAHTEVIDGLAVRTLSDEDTLSLLAVSASEDVAFGMAKLRALCDVWLLARHLDAHTDWEAWLARRRGENLEAVAVNGLAFALLVLEREEDAPRLTEAIAKRGLIVLSGRERALALLASPGASAATMAWFAEIYPGSRLRFTVNSFVAGLPATLRQVNLARLRLEVDVLRQTTRPET
jgi:hypothetical protein